MNMGNILFPLVLVGAALTGSFYTGWVSGKANVQTAWNIERSTLAAAANKVEQENRNKEQAHYQETLALTEQLKREKAEYEKALADLESDYTRRMQLSEERAARYREWAEAGDTERGGLADHAARLDIALTEGRALVEELWETVRQRERELRALGEQIITDRRLFGE